MLHIRFAISLRQNVRVYVSESQICLDSYAHGGRCCISDLLSHSVSILTPGWPVHTLTLYCQVYGWVAMSGPACISITVESVDCGKLMVAHPHKATIGVFSTDLFIRLSVLQCWIAAMWTSFCSIESTHGGRVSALASQPKACHHCWSMSVHLLLSAKISTIAEACQCTCFPAQGLPPLLKHVSALASQRKACHWCWSVSVSVSVHLLLSARLATIAEAWFPVLVTTPWMVRLTSYLPVKTVTPKPQFSKDCAENVATAKTLQAFSLPEFVMETRILGEMKIKNCRGKNVA